MSEHKEIYLQPECCADPDIGRLWCQDPDPENCDEGVPWTKYVRADLTQQLQSDKAELEAQLSDYRDACSQKQEVIEAAEGVRKEYQRRDAELSAELAQVRGEKEKLWEALAHFYPELKSIRNLALEGLNQTGIPECAHYGSIYQTLDYICGQIDAMPKTPELAKLLDEALSTDTGEGERHTPPI